MAINCNKLVQLTDDALEAKASLARAASVALTGAVSDCYRGIELAHGAIGGAGRVYFASAATKLRTAIEALRQLDGILQSAPLTGDTLVWSRCLDFERLYREGVESGVIPAHEEQWSRLATAMTRGRVLSVTSTLVDDLSTIQLYLHETSDASGEDGSHRNRVGVPFSVLRVQSALLDTVAFAQMVAYVNNLEPLDTRWLTVVGDGELAAGVTA